MVLAKDHIRLEVAPEFSQIDTETSVNGTPGLRTRAVTTTVEMREGQTLAIAGLLDDSMKGDLPTYRDIWHRIREHLPKKGRGKEAVAGEPKLPVELEGALQSLYGNYEKHYRQWEKAYREMRSRYTVLLPAPPANAQPPAPGAMPK